MHLIEPLEQRIAPASVFVFTDVDGDLVKITASKGNLAVDAPMLFTPGGQLRMLDLTDPVFQGANIIFTVTKIGAGNGRADVGYINAAGRDLGTVIVKGDLGQIDAGDGDPATLGLKRLSAQSLGGRGLTTQGGTGDLFSNIEGGLGALSVAGDVIAAIVRAGGPLGSVTIGGSLAGGGFDGDGQIVSTGNMGPVKIGGSIVGSVGFSSGAIIAGGKLASVSIGGSLRGGDGDRSGHIFSGGDAGPITIVGGILGNDGDLSGSILTEGSKLGSVKVGGSLSGGKGERSGLIDASSGALGAVSIGEHVLGGQGKRSGSIHSAKNLASVKVGGVVEGDTGDGSGIVVAEGALGAVWIGDNLLGSDGFSSGVIVAVGNVAKVTVRGSVNGGSGNGSGQIVSESGSIGPVSIGKNLEGLGYYSGRIVATKDLASVSIGGLLRGGARDQSGGIVAGGTLGPVKIAGDLQGGGVSFAADSLDHSGYLEAGRIASVTIGGSLKAGLDQSAGTLTNSGSIRAEHSIGPIVVRGSILGSETKDGIAYISISARGQLVPTATSDLAIASLTVAGSVERAAINVGFSPTDRGLNADAQIGAVKVAGNWKASHLLVGIDPGPDGKVATGDDFKLAGNYGAGPVRDDRPIAQIASIVIGGEVLGTSAGGDHFGFVAEQIGAFRSLGYVAKLTAGKDGARLLDPTTGDIVWREF